MIGYFDVNGTPIDPDTFYRLKWDESGTVSRYSRVGRHDTVNGEVSTVWLGLDHRFGYGPPMIFETIIFGGPHDGQLRRYCTKAEALRGHRQAVNNLARGKQPWEDTDA